MYPIDEILFSGQYEDMFVRIGIAHIGDDEYLRRIVIDRDGDVIDDWAHLRHKLLPGTVPPKNPIVRSVVQALDNYLRRRDNAVYKDFMEQVESLRKL
ncbi:MAG TPA: hypothetical protein VJB05_02335 [archaeon]|nr:hypothetical protein [archaeon]